MILGFISGAKSAEVHSKHNEHKLLIYMRADKKQVTVGSKHTVSGGPLTRKETGGPMHMVKEWIKEKVFKPLKKG